MAHEDKHRLTLRIPNAAKDSLKAMSDRTGMPMTELINTGVLLLLGHEEAMRSYENRMDEFLSSASLRFDLLVSELREDVEETKKRIADIIEADHALIAEFSETMNRYLNLLNAAGIIAGQRGSSTERPTPGSAVRYSATGAPIWD